MSIIGREVEFLAPPTDRPAPGFDPGEDWPSPDGFEPLARLGSGGMGSVFLVRNATKSTSPEARRPLILKAPHAHLLFGGFGQQIRDRFAHEVHTLARCADVDGLPRLHCFDLDGERPYLVLDWLHGRTLHDVIDRGARGGAPPSLMLVAEVGVRCLDILLALHERGFLHRDWKPDNIFLTPDPNMPVVALDTGIARRFDWARLTGTDMVAASPAFAAPEVLARHNADIRSEVFSLGMTLLECFGIPATDMRTRQARLTPAYEEALSRIPHRALAELLRQMTYQDSSRRPILNEARARLAHIRADLVRLDAETAPSSAKALSGAARPVRGAMGRSEQPRAVDHEKHRIPSETVSDTLDMDPDRTELLGDDPTLFNRPVGGSRSENVAPAPFARPAIRSVSRGLAHVGLWLALVPVASLALALMLAAGQWLSPLSNWVDPLRGDTSAYPASGDPLSWSHAFAYLTALIMPLPRFFLLCVAGVLVASGSSWVVALVPCLPWMPANLRPCANWSYVRTANHLRETLSLRVWSWATVVVAAILPLLPVYSFATLTWLGTVAVLVIAAFMLLSWKEFLLDAREGLTSWKASQRLAPAPPP